MVAALDPAVANRLFEGEWNGSARRVAELVDVDRDALDRQADPPRCGVDDPVVGLVQDPQVDLVEPDDRSLADLGRLADEDVDGELENVRSDHFDVWLGVLS